MSYKIEIKFSFFYFNFFLNQKHHPKICCNNSVKNRTRSLYTIKLSAIQRDGSLTKK